MAAILGSGDYKYEVVENWGRCLTDGLFMKWQPLQSMLKTRSIASPAANILSSCLIAMATSSVLGAMAFSKEPMAQPWVPIKRFF